MEILRAVVVLLGVSMFFSIITSVLTASEELRVNFPSTKYLGGNSPETIHGDGRGANQDTPENNAVKDIERGILSNSENGSEEHNKSKTGSTLLPESENIECLREDLNELTKDKEENQ